MATLRKMQFASGVFRVDNAAIGLAGRIVAFWEIAMSIRIPAVTNAEVETLVDTMDRTGFAVLPDFIQSDDLARMRAFVSQAIANSGGEYAGFSGPDDVAGSGLDDLAVAEPFRGLIERIYERGTGRPAPAQNFYQVLRCLTGQSTQVHSNVFHYDSYVVTVLIPIEIPGKGQTGDFLMLPNTRRIRRHYLLNAIDKVLLDNAATQWALRKLTAAGAIKLTRIKMVPGRAYVFWGYRSIHTNDPCDPDQVRATALFHYANPHARPQANLGGQRLAMANGSAAA